MRRLHVRVTPGGFALLWMLPAPQRQRATSGWSACAAWSNVSSAGQTASRLRRKTL